MAISIALYGDITRLYKYMVRECRTYKILRHAARESSNSLRWSLGIPSMIPRPSSPDCFAFLFLFLFFSIPFIIFALLFSLPPSRNSDPGSHSRLFSPPPHYGSCLAFLSQEDFSSFLVDSRRIVLTMSTLV